MSDVVLPVAPHGRTVVAKTCDGCGRLKSRSEFAGRGGGKRLCRPCINTRRAISARQNGVRPKLLHKGVVLLGATCIHCGQFRQGGDFKTVRGVPSTATCRACSYARSEKKDPGVHRETVQRYRDARQQPTLLTADHHGEQWTGAQLELVARDDLTLAELALMLGRTHNAVRGARERVRKEPKYVSAAGLAATQERLR